MPGNQSHPKDIWSKNSTSPYEFFWPKLKGPSFKCSSEYNRCGLTKVILYSHPKTNSSHMSGVSCPQKETHLFQSQLFLCCYFGFFFVIQVFEFEFVIPFASGSYQRRHSDDVWARDEGQTTASEDCREGISCFSIEESNLRPSWMLIGYAERLMLVAPWGFGAQLVFQRLSLMYTKSPWVLVEIYHHCSFGHSERSDLRDKISGSTNWTRVMSYIYFSFKKSEHLKIAITAYH